MSKILWVLMDDRRGSVGQALGVIGALNKNKFTAIEKQVCYTKWARLPNLIRNYSLIGLTADSKKNICPPFPDYVLSISRRTAPIALYIKKHSPQTKIIQLMHPGNAGLSDFDLVIVPKHDKNKKNVPNIHYITGCPHKITPEFLQNARNIWAEKFADLPKPLTAVIIGGAIKNKPFSDDNAIALGKAVNKLKQKIGGAILLTTSRRTGKSAEKLILNELQNIPQYTYLWGDISENPYSGFLACADNIIVTGDSVSMCCEATATKKPLYIFTGRNWLTAKHQRFIDSLCEDCCAILLEDENAADFIPQKSLNAAQEVAELIEKL